MTDFRLCSLVAEVAGDGPAVVMVHGLGGSSNSFQPLMPGLAGYRVIRPDLPGAARSALRPGRLRRMALRQALHDLIRACRVSAAHLVGHSIGPLLCLSPAGAEQRLVLVPPSSRPTMGPPEGARGGSKVRSDTVRRNGI